MIGSLHARLQALRSQPQWQAVFANLSWLGLDKVARMGISVVVGGWVARHLGAADYGLMNYSVAMIALVAVVPGLGLDTLLRRELVRHPEERDRLLGTAFWLRLGTGALAYGALMAGVLAGEDDSRARLIIAINGLSLLQCSTLVFDFWFQVQLRSKYTVLAQNIAFAISSLGRVILILQDADVVAFGLMLALDLPLIAGLNWFFYHRLSGPIRAWRWDGGYARRLLAESWPLALSGVAVLIYLRIDQVMLRQMSGDAETGHYAAAVRLAEVWNFVPPAFAISLSPLLGRARQGLVADYERMVRRSFALATLACWAVALPTMAAAPWIVRLLFGPEFAATTPMLVLLAACLPFIALGVMRQEYLVYEGAARFQLFTTTLGALVNVVLNLWLIPRWGGVGAAAATLAAQLVAGMLTSFASSRFRRVGFWQLEALFTPWRLLRSEKPAA